MLTKIVSAVYTVAGVLKIHPPDAIRLNMDKAFHSFAEYCPTVLLGYQPDGYMYRTALGWIELSLAFSLLFGPVPVKKISCCGLMIIMTGAIYTMICLQYYAPIIAPVCFLLALGYQLKLLSFSEKRKDS